ncbi:hypothetical protein EB796_020006 [Bugula neritina]|uniref:Uncharacterized protein n=1 Tax=Bugula neritina TaxID=10212 RepID=A0A7J7J6Y5_BUGNE|nr:hypothetical protein EB796_020006 [Bugula neritina]
MVIAMALLSTSHASGYNSYSLRSHRIRYCCKYGKVQRKICPGLHLGGYAPRCHYVYSTVCKKYCYRPIIRRRPIRYQQHY